MPGETNQEVIEALLNGEWTPALKQRLQTAEGRAEVTRLLKRLESAGGMISLNADDETAIPERIMERLLQTSIDAFAEAPTSDSSIRTLAVMFTDMAGSTEYAQRHGAEAARAKQRAHNDLLVSLVDQHGGTLLKKMGDALLVIFDQAIGAARCAIAMQRTVATYNRSASLKPDDQIHIRIGFHWGKAVVYDDDGRLDITGSAADVAARVESGGGKQTDQILLSESAFAKLTPHQDELTIERHSTITAKGVGALNLLRLIWDETEARETTPLKLAAQNADALAQRVAESENTRGVRCLFVDPASGRGFIRPVFVNVVASATPRIVPKVDCDRVMQAATARAVQGAFAVLQRLGFHDAVADQHHVRWWIEGPTAQYEGASIGLAVALATVAAYAGVPVDATLVVTGGTSENRVTSITGLDAKWQRVCAEQDIQTVVLPKDNLAALSDATSGGAVPIAVETIDDAVIDVFGPALGLGARRLHQMSTMKSAEAPDEATASVNIRLWVESADAPPTRDIAFVGESAAGTRKLGDRIAICAEADRDCHLALINIGPTGNITVLIPNQRFSSDVTAGRPVRFGPFELQEPVGRERVIAIASAHPLHLKPKDFDQAGQFVATPRTRDIAFVADNTEKDVIGRSEIEFFVTDRRETSRSTTRSIVAPEEKESLRSIDLD